MNESLIAPSPPSTLDWRPTSLDTFVGQDAFKKQLRVEIAASIRQQRPVRNILLSGLQGTGKSTIAGIIAMERGSPPPIVCVGKGLNIQQLSSILNTLGHQGRKGYSADGYLVDPSIATYPVVVLDEVDAVEKPVLETLHPILEPGSDGRRIFNAIGPRGQRGPCWAIGLTVIAVTNYLGTFLKDNGPTASRFPIQYVFEPYTDKQLSTIIQGMAIRAGFKIEDDAAELLASRANSMPRTAINLLKRAVDFRSADDESNRILDYQSISETLEILEIDEFGLDRQMRCVLKTLAEAGGKLSLQGLASILQADEKTLVYVIEPVLLRKGFLNRRSSGREITQAGRLALGRQDNDPFTSQLL